MWSRLNLCCKFVIKVSSLRGSSKTESHAPTSSSRPSIAPPPLKHLPPARHLVLKLVCTLFKTELQKVIWNSTILTWQIHRPNNWNICQRVIVCRSTTLQAWKQERWRKHHYIAIVLTTDGTLTAVKILVGWSGEWYLQVDWFYNGRSIKLLYLLSKLKFIEASNVHSLNQN